MPDGVWGRVVPITFHWDEVKYGRTSGADAEMFCVSFSSAIARGQVCITKFPWCQVPVYLAGTRTHRHLIKLAISEIEGLMTGLMPDGSPITPGGHRFMFAGNKFDLKAKQQLNSFGRFWQCNFICEWDLASKHLSGCRFGDHRECAGWTKTCVSTASYVRAGGQSPFLAMPGFSLDLSLPDCMHVLFHNGLVSQIVGSVLKERCREHAFAGDTLEAQLLDAHSSFMSWLGSQEHTRNDDRHFVQPFSTLSMHMEPDYEYPTVSTSYKCMTVLHMLFWLASQHAVDGSFYLRCRSVMLVSFANFASVTRNGDFLLSTEEQRLAHRSGRVGLLNFQYLALENLKQGISLYRSLPKSHQFDHVIHRLKTSRFNSAYWECWGEETLLGKLKGLDSRVHAKSALLRSLQRYRLTIVHELQIPA